MNAQQAYRIMPRSRRTPRQSLDLAFLTATSIWITTSLIQKRFCFELEETEWLLGTSDRWMRPSNLNISGAEAKSEAKLQEHNRRPWVVRARSRTFQAEYNRTFSLKISSAASPTSSALSGRRSMATNTVTMATAGAAAEAPSWEMALIHRTIVLIQNRRLWRARG